ncbi:MAG: BamA/TamA family outer membrane protein [Sphingorhabdus sp.]
MSQLAHNTALGMAAVCGNSTSPLAELGDPFERSIVRFSAASASAIEKQRMEASGRIDSLTRRFVPHATLAFSAIDPDQSGPSLPIITSSGLHSPGLRALQTIRNWEARQAQSKTKAAETSEAFTSDDAKISGGYIFFSGSVAPNETMGATQVGSDKNTFGKEGDPASFSAGLSPLNDIAKTGVGNDITVSDTADVNTMSGSPISRGGISLSGGFSSIEGLNLGGRIARGNIGSKDREISASARYSSIRQIFEIGYADNDFLGIDIGFAPTLFANRTTAKGFGNGIKTARFTQSIQGIDIRLSRKFDNHLSIAANYRLSKHSFHLRGKNNICDSASFGSPLCGTIGGNIVSSLNLSILLDRRRQEDDGATRGFRFRIAQDIGIGGSAPFAKTRLGGEAHIGLAADWTLLLDAEGGYLAPVGHGRVPLFDRFYVGNASLRGFDLRGVGPKIRPISAAAGQNIAIGGRAYYSARAELSGNVGNVFKKHGLQPSLFIDAGSAFGAKDWRLLPGETLLGNSPKPRISLGLGLALKTPVGSLRLDGAYPLIKQQGDRTKAFAISFNAVV